MMRERIVNFANKENQLINWNRLTSIHYNRLFDFEQELENLLGQLNLLLEKYPDALKQESVLKKSKALVEYAKKHDFTLSNCYSYSNTVKVPIKMALDVGKYSYGIRTLIDDSIFYPSIVTVTCYTSTASGFIIDKDQLNLRIRYGELGYSNFVHQESKGTFIYDKNVLSDLKPNILTKHL